MKHDMARCMRNNKHMCVGHDLKFQVWPKRTCTSMLRKHLKATHTRQGHTHQHTRQSGVGTRHNDKHTHVGLDG